MRFVTAQSGDDRERAVTNRTYEFFSDRLLENIEFFKQVQVDHEAGTLVWPNQVDLDPDVLYAEVIGTSIRAEALV